MIWSSYWSLCVEDPEKEVPRVRRMAKLFTKAAATLLIVAVVSLLPGGEGATQESTTANPNIILILTDDQDVPSMAYMPRVKAKLVEQGTTLKNGFVTAPLCCPSRASILRGQYVHNHTIKGGRTSLTTGSGTRGARSLPSPRSCTTAATALRSSAST